MNQHSGLRSLYICYAKRVARLLNYEKVMKEMLYEVRCLKSNEDVILALAGQLSNCLMNLKNFQSPENFSGS